MHMSSRVKMCITSTMLLVFVAFYRHAKGIYVCMQHLHKERNENGFHY